MNKLLNSIISSLFFIATACSIQSSQQRLATESSEIQNPSFHPTASPSPIKVENLQVNPTDLTIIKNYAESYEPTPKKNTVIPSTPTPNEKVMQAIDALANSQSREHEKYIVLIFLRLHRYHAENFKQSYDLGGNPLAREFYRLTLENYNPKGEPKLSYIAENWVKKNPELLKYSLIADEIKRLKKQEKKSFINPKY